MYSQPLPSFAPTSKVRVNNRFNGISQPSHVLQKDDSIKFTGQQSSKLQPGPSRQTLTETINNKAKNLGYLCAQKWQETMRRSKRKQAQETKSDKKADIWWSPFGGFPG
jgi:hypothetical protein